MSLGTPPKSVPLIIRQFNGRVLSGVVIDIDHQRSMIRVTRISILEVVGLKKGLEPIYGKKAKVRGFLDIPIDTIVHWESLPDYLKLED